MARTVEITTADLVPCRRHCSMCEGMDHHWIYCGDHDGAGEPLMSCKHCEAVRAIQDDDD